jgi:alkyl hydroperoxide reductase subunit AhpC
MKTEVLVCSTDSKYAHLEWARKPRDKGGLCSMAVPMPIVPMLADTNHRISRDYGVLNEDQGSSYRYYTPSILFPSLCQLSSHFRGLFIIDPMGMLRQLIINDLTVGRSVDETLRLVQALQIGYDDTILDRED